MVHLVTLGAGGGSIAHFNRLFNSVEIGPQSAGSDPGPACYDRGGLKPTVTDADLVLGYLDPKNYANGRIPLNPKRSEEHTSELQSLMRTSYAVFCLTKKKPVYDNTALLNALRHPDNDIQHSNTTQDLSNQ